MNNIRTRFTRVASVCCFFLPKVGNRRFLGVYFLYKYNLTKIKSDFVFPFGKPSETDSGIDKVRQSETVTQ